MSDDAVKVLQAQAIAAKVYVLRRRRDRGELSAHDQVILAEAERRLGMSKPDGVEATLTYKGKTARLEDVAAELDKREGPADDQPPLPGMPPQRADGIRLQGQAELRRVVLGYDRHGHRVVVAYYRLQDGPAEVSGREEIPLAEELFDEVVLAALRKMQICHGAKKPERVQTSAQDGAADGAS